MTQQGLLNWIHCTVLLSLFVYSSTKYNSFKNDFNDDDGDQVCVYINVGSLSSSKFYFRYEFL